MKIKTAEFVISNAKLSRCPEEDRGEYAFIGAGTVVTKDIPNHALVIGNPGVVIGWVNKEGSKIDFNPDGKSICGNYFLNDDTLSFIG